MVMYCWKLLVFTMAARCVVRTMQGDFAPPKADERTYGSQVPNIKALMSLLQSSASRSATWLGNA